MANSIIKFEALNGKTTERDYIEDLKIQAFNEKQLDVYNRLSKLLLTHPEATHFDLEIKSSLDSVKSNIQAESPQENNSTEEDFEALGIPYLTEAEAEKLEVSETRGLAGSFSSEDMYNKVTDGIIKSIEASGDIPWYSGRDKEKDSKVLTFRASPLNGFTKKYYRGINFFILGLEHSHYETQIVNGKEEKIEIKKFRTDENQTWLTFKQAKELGGKLKKGAKSEQCMYYNFRYFYKDKKVSQKKFEELQKEKGCEILTTKGCEDFKRIAFLSYYNVFNEVDIEGIDFEAIKNELKANSVEIESEDQKILAADLIYENMPLKPEVIKRHIAPNEAPFYFPKNDTIVMPLKKQYDNVAIWYGTLFHEAIHATGHKKRLDRATLLDYGKSDEIRALEEITAELGATFLNAESGIFFHTLKKNTAYIKNWSKHVVSALKADNKAIFKVAGAAQKAADYILNRNEKGEPKFYQSFEKLKAEASKETEKKEDKTQENNYPFSLDDIPYETGRRAHLHTSFYPEKRAKQEQKYYFNDLKQIFDKYHSEAVKKGLEDKFNNLFSKFQAGFLKRRISELQSRSRIASTMITGGSNFNVRRNEKANNAYENKLKETAHYYEKYQKYFDDLIFPTLKPIKTGKKGSLEKLEEKLKVLEEKHALMKKGNAKIRQLQKKGLSPLDLIAEYEKYLIEIGFTQKEVESIVNLPKREEKLMYLPFHLQNSNAKIRTVKQRINLEKRLQDQAKKADETGETKELKFKGGVIINDFSDKRIKIDFDEKPSLEVRNFLKQSGHRFKWSPYNKVWQRQLNTYYSLNRKELYEFLGVETPTPEPPKETKKEPEAKKDENGQFALFGKLAGDIKISSDKFSSFTTRELRVFMLQYYNQFLKGKNIAAGNAIKNIELLNRAGRKISKGSAVYSAKAAVVEHLEEVIKNSTYNNFGKPKEKDNKDLLGYMNFKSKVLIDGEKRHVRVVVELFKSRKTLLKTYEIGKKPHSSKDSQKLSSSPNKAILDKNIKNENDIENLGTVFLGSPDIIGNSHQLETVENQSIVVVENKKLPEIKQPEVVHDFSDKVTEKISQSKVKNKLVQGLTKAKTAASQVETFNLTGEIAKFLGELERKNKHSVVITLDAPAGSGKTRFMFQLLNMVAGNGYSCVFFSFEEHPESKLFANKATMYIDAANEANIDVVGDLPETYDEFLEIVEAYDFIAVDSWNKAFEKYKVDFDNDLRKRVDGKLIAAIFQRTSGGQMRGGSKSEFDGDVILEVEKADDFRNSYVIARKNRYQDIPLNEIAYNFYHQKVINPSVENQEINLPDAVLL